MNARAAALVALILAAVAAPALAQDAGTLKKLRDSGSITLGIRESSYPLSYLDDRQQPVGYHIDVCNRIVDAVKARLKLPALKVQHQAVTSQNRIPLVANGTVDLECGSTTNNEALETDRAVAFVMDDNLLAGLIVSSKSPADYAIVGEVLNIEPIAIMLRKDDPEFKKLVDETVIGLMKSGELDKLYARWFMSPIPPRNVSMNFPMSEQLKALIKAPSDAPAESFNRK